MANTTQNRDALHGDGDLYGYGVASGIHLYAGTIGALVGGNYLGKAAAGATTLVGVVVDEADNTSSNTKITVAQGALNARVARRGIFRFNSSVTPTQAGIGQKAYPTDDQTVGVTSAAGVSGGIQYLGTVVGYGTTPYNYYDVDIDTNFRS